VTLDGAPFRQIEHDPEGFRYIQLGSSGLAYLLVSDDPMRRDLCHLAKSAYGAADNPGTLCEPVLALCRAPDCEVFMATSHSQRAEQGAVFPQYVVSRVSKFYRVHHRNHSPVFTCVPDHAFRGLNR